eukprot:6562229-Pyramimonas_sp.AAC.1
MSSVLSRSAGRHPGGLGGPRTPGGRRWCPSGVPCAVPVALGSTWATSLRALSRPQCLRSLGGYVIAAR